MAITVYLMEMDYSSETGILYGGPAPVDICAGYSNLGDFITEKLRENGDQVALVSLSKYFIIFSTSFPRVGILYLSFIMCR